MKRQCTQSLKVLFPKNTYFNTETTITLPKSGNMITKIRLVINFSTANTLGENVINECELMASGKTIEKIYGDFLHVENLLKTPIEKRDKLNQLLCKNVPGVMYLDIPFHSVKKGIYMNDNYELRILFGQGQNQEIDGYLLLDYTLIDNPPKFPFFEKIRQIQKLTSLVTNSKQVTMDVYLAGSIYELYFTVSNSSGNFVDAIKNIKFLVGNNERFNLTGDYLRLVEPMKRYGRISSEPVYMYSLCLDPNNIYIPSGQTNFPDKQRFIIELYDNNDTYTLTIFAQNHNFYYSTESNVSPVFESTEMLLASEIIPSTSYSQLPIKTSYTNYANTATISYTSDYEITDVTLYSNIVNYTITQNEINFTGIDSIKGSYYANVTYTAKGFSNLTCSYLIQGSNLMKTTSLDVLGIDEGQKYYIKTNLGTGINNTVLLGDYISILGPETRPILINQYRDLFFSGYATGLGNLVFYNSDGSSITLQNIGEGVPFVKYSKDFFLKYVVYYTNTFGGTDGVVSNYDTDIMFYSYVNSSKTNGSSSSLGMPSTLDAHECTILNIKNDRYNFVNYIDGNSSFLNFVKIDSDLNFYVSGGIYTTDSLTFINSDGSTRTSNQGQGPKSFIAKFDSNGTLIFYIVMDNLLKGYNDGIASNPPTYTAIEIDNDQNICAIFNVNSSNLYSSYGTFVNFTNVQKGKVIIKFDKNGNILWNKKITDVGDMNSLYVTEGSFMNYNKYLNNFYILTDCFSSNAKVENTSLPSVFGNYLLSILLKLDTDGNIKWIMTFHAPGVENLAGELRMIVDQCTGNIIFYMFTMGNNTQIYLNGVYKYTLNFSVSSYIVFDTNGQILSTSQGDINNIPTIAVDDFFSVVKNPYYTPLCDGTFFKV